MLMGHRITVYLCKTFPILVWYSSQIFQSNNAFLASNTNGRKLAFPKLIFLATIITYDSIILNTRGIMEQLPVWQWHKFSLVKTRILNIPLDYHHGLNFPPINIYTKTHLWYYGSSKVPKEKGRKINGWRKEGRQSLRASHTEMHRSHFKEWRHCILLWN